MIVADSQRDLSDAGYKPCQNRAVEASRPSLKYIRTYYI